MWKDFKRVVFVRKFIFYSKDRRYRDPNKLQQNVLGFWAVRRKSLE